jgi:hypothetical protein
MNTTMHASVVFHGVRQIVGRWLSTCTRSISLGQRTRCIAAIGKLVTRINMSSKNLLVK